MTSETGTDSHENSRFRGLLGILPKADAVVRVLGKATSRVPFMDDVLAMWYCAVDPATPAKIRFAIAGALFYFVCPFDVIPDLAPILGFSDDIGAILLVSKLVSSHVTERHRGRAREKLAALDGRAVAAP
jgi:uncharacterized membrane protein YkvA (DUF1232 family)